MQSQKKELGQAIINITAARGGGSGVVYIDLGTSFPSSEDPPDDIPGSQESQASQAPGSPRVPEIPGFPGSPRPQDLRDLPRPQDPQDPRVPSRRAKPPTAKFWRPVSRGQLGSAGLLLVHFLPPVAGRFPSISSHKPRKTAFDRARRRKVQNGCLGRPPLRGLVCTGFHRSGDARADLGRCHFSELSRSGLPI